jgi:hypothetical protein
MYVKIVILSETVGRVEGSVKKEVPKNRFLDCVPLRSDFAELRSE